MRKKPNGNVPLWEWSAPYYIEKSRTKSLFATQMKRQTDWLLRVCVCCLLLATASAKGPITLGKSNNIIGGFSKSLATDELFLQKNNSESRAQVGATATLHCMLSAPLADGLVSWVRRKDYHLLTVGRQVYSSDHRFGVKVSPDGRDWILNIRFVKIHDAGQYECQVSSHPSQSLMVQLNVVRAHGRILGESERHIHNGSSLRLVCLVEDATEPPVYVFWYRQNRMINYDKESGVSVSNTKEASVLFIASVTSEDQGNYTCTPSNASPTSVIVHVIRRENPAGLQQETNPEKESASPAPSSVTSSAVLYSVNGQAFLLILAWWSFVLSSRFLPTQPSSR